MHFVKLSTLPQADEMLLARSAIEALADRPYRVLLTLPPGQPREQLGIPPANVQACDLVLSVGSA